MAEVSGIDAPPGRVVRRPAPYGRVLITGVLCGVLVMIPALLLYWILRLVGVPFEAATSPTGPIDLVGTWQMILAPIVAGFLGAALAGTFRTLYNGPRITAVVLGALTVLSCVPLFIQPDGVTMSTKISLLVLHLLVGGALTWVLSRAVTSEDPPPEVIADLDSRHPGAGVAPRR